ncbi:UPF0060 membrane protein YfjF [Chlorella vulgaris]
MLGSAGGAASVQSIMQALESHANMLSMAATTPSPSDQGDGEAESAKFHWTAGKVYAVYGGFFVLGSYLWGWALDGTKPDIGDWVGTAIAMVGVILAFFWPRN